MLWIKAFHIIAVTCWFAMLFYLPRLFVYHIMSDDDVSKERFCTMERKLYRAIGTPSMIAAILLGGSLVSFNWDYYSGSAWFWMKLFLVFILVAYHLTCGAFVKKFQRDEIDKSHVFFRWFNEFPVILLISIVVLVIVKQPV